MKLWIVILIPIVIFQTTLSSQLDNLAKLTNSAYTAYTDFELKKTPNVARCEI